uniref:prophage side tail fiber protein homolog StfR-like isoform X2 n=1 Tax=Myxine glutinosa TaxID=7769 RepID=UPI00358FFA38
MAASFCRTHLVFSVFQTVRVKTAVVWTFRPLGVRAIAVGWPHFRVNFAWSQESAQRNLFQKQRFLAAERCVLSCHPGMQRPCTCSAGAAAGPAGGATATGTAGAAAGTAGAAAGTDEGAAGTTRDVAESTGGAAGTIAGAAAGPAGGATATGTAGAAAGTAGGAAGTAKGAAESSFSAGTAKCAAGTTRDAAEPAKCAARTTAGGVAEAAISAETMETVVVLETADAMKDADVAEASVDVKAAVVLEPSEATLAAKPVIAMETVNTQDVASTFVDNDACRLRLGGFEPTSYTSALEHLSQQSEVIPHSEAGVLSLDNLVQTLRQENGCDICVIRIPPSLCYTDHMVIVTASSHRHLVALAEYVHKLYKSVKSSSDPHVLLEGKTSEDWMCIDFGPTVLHIMLEKTRKRYEIEKLWTLREMDDQLELLQPEFLPDDLILEGHETEHHWGLEVPPDENKL